MPIENHLLEMPTEKLLLWLSFAVIMAIIISLTYYHVEALSFERRERMEIINKIEKTEIVRCPSCLRHTAEEFQKKLDETKKESRKNQ